MLGMNNPHTKKLSEILSPENVGMLMAYRQSLAMYADPNHIPGEDMDSDYLASMVMALEPAQIQGMMMGILLALEADARGTEMMPMRQMHREMTMIYATLEGLLMEKIGGKLT